MTGRTLYTVGHSNQTFEDLLGMLQSQHINVIVDVRMRSLFRVVTEDGEPKWIRPVQRGAEHEEIVSKTAGKLRIPSRKIKE